MVDPLSAQYASLTERRIHFGKMYWQNIGLHCAGLLAAAAIFRDLAAPWLGVALAIAGAATLLMAYIAARIRTLEVSYERALGAIEEAWIAAGHVSVQRAPISGPRGARFAVNLTLALAGAVMLAIGLYLALAIG